VAVRPALEVAQHAHVVQFYAADDELVTTVVPFLREALCTRGVAIVVATRAHRVAFEAELRADGVDTSAAKASGALVLIDAAELLASFRRGNGFDEHAFDRVVGSVLRRAARRHRRVRVYGEMVALLWDAGDIEAAIELERMWQRLQRTVPFALWCAYRSEPEEGGGVAPEFTTVCDLHTTVVAEGVESPMSSPAEPDNISCIESRSFIASPTTPSEARRFVERTLAGWGETRHVEDAMLLVSELTTNAVVHARTGLTVAIERGRDAMRISVHDASPVTLRNRSPRSRSQSGRGLVLVAAVADRWGSDVTDGGKVVWADVVL